MSLRTSVALVIAALSLLPNLAIAGVVLLPTLSLQPELAGSLLPPVAAWMIAVAALSAVIGHALARSLLQPLTRLKDDVAGLQASGRRLAALRLDDPGSQPSEVAAVRKSFAALLESLRDEQQKRSAFMATLVHDLKTPILAANHVLQVVRDQASLTPTERVALVGSVLDENRRLLNLVQKMVDAHRFERQQLQLHLVPVDLGAIARSIAQRHRPTNRELAVEEHDARHVLGSPDELERAVDNLVENALRYSRSRVSIEVVGVSLAVHDDGPGLPAPLEHLAEPFRSEQVELAGKRYTAGTGGLGLFITDQIARAHGGTLESTASSSGASLRLTLRPA